MTVHPAPGSPRERWLTLCCTIVKAGCRVSAVSSARESSIESIRIHQGFWLWPKMIRHIKTCANSLPDILLKGLIMLWFSGCRIRQTAESKRLSAAVRMIVKNGDCEEKRQKRNYQLQNSGGFQVFGQLGTVQSGDRPYPSDSRAYEFSGVQPYRRSAL